MNIGIIGAGVIGKKRAEAVKSCRDNLTIVADVDINKARSLAKEYKCSFTDSWQDVIYRPDIDVIVIATTSDMLCKLTLAALKAKKHVLCEKPLGRNFNEASRIYKSACSGNVVLKVGFNHRFHPAIIKAHNLLNKGAIGNIMYVKSVYGHGGRKNYHKEWRMDPKISSGGELTDQGVHVLDLLRWFMGEFDEAFAINGNMFWKQSSLEDNSFILLRTKDKKVASAHFSLTQWRNKFLFEIFGERGHLIIEGLGRSYGREKLIYGDRKRLGKAPSESIFSFPKKDISWELEWRNFIKAIKDKRQPIGNGYDGMKANELLSALYKSARLNKVIKIGDTNGR